MQFGLIRGESPERSGGFPWCGPACCFDSAPRPAIIALRNFKLRYAIMPNTIFKVAAFIWHGLPSRLRESSFAAGLRDWGRTALDRMHPSLPQSSARSGSMLVSCLCTEESLRSDAFQAWAVRLGESPNHMHRKVWEWCYISQALKERNLLRPGIRGLGFAVGTEPLSSAFATHGVLVVATDLYTQEAQAKGWIETNQHAEGYDAINARKLCSDTELRRLVEFKFADMKDISADFFGKFDFVWSSCALEHLGTLEYGKAFIYNAMRCLKPGGIAVHTTEYNLSSNTTTVESGDTVLFRKRDIEDVIRSLRSQGHEIDMDWNEGNGYSDGFIDVPPYEHKTHLKLQIGQYIVTSLGMIIRKNG